MSREKFLIANWKLAKVAKETEEYIQEIEKVASSFPGTFGIAPPYTSLYAASKQAENTSILIGAQNMSEHLEGAYTGEISARMIQDAGGKFVIIGHSERRHIFHEDLETIRRKVKRALEEGFLVILCVGEMLEDRNEGRVEEYLTLQLKTATEGLDSAMLNRLIIAYEPVWAIGTGVAATPQIANETHLFCRFFIRNTFGENIGEKMPILYGGSVKPENITSFLQMEHVDGALIGGASLTIESMQTMIQQARECLE